MVNFSVFNELSLPLDQYKAVDTFIQFFKLLTKLNKENGFNKIRMDCDFKYYDLFEDITLQQFLGQQKDRDFNTRLKSFINNQISVIETPIIKKEEQKQQDELNSCEYFYENKATDSGLACCDIWNTIAVSFATQSEWKNPLIPLKKESLSTDDSIQIQQIEIRHLSNKVHLKHHQDFFKAIAEEHKLGISQRHFWENRKTYFPNIICFCPEVEGQVKKLDKMVFKLAISILRELETQQKLPTDYEWSPESENVRTDPKLKNFRTFTLLDKKTFFSHHIKSLSKGYRMYFLEENKKIYIGYIGKHLPL